MPTKSPIVRVNPPALCRELLPGYAFADGYRVATHLDAPAVAEAIFHHPPAWFAALMALRNGIIRLLGLKAVALNGFPVLWSSAGRVVLGLDDRHLDFRILIQAEGGVATVSTIVRPHNRLGRLYLAAVLPVHRMISRQSLEGIARMARA